MPVYGYNLDPTNIFWLVGGAIVLVVVMLDTEWKRRLFETYAEKLARDPKYREKELNRRLKDKPWLIPGNKSWAEMQKELEEKQKR